MNLNENQWNGATTLRIIIGNLAYVFSCLLDCYKFDM